MQELLPLVVIPWILASVPWLCSKGANGFLVTTVHFAINNEICDSWMDVLNRCVVVTDLFGLDVAVTLDIKNWTPCTLPKVSSRVSLLLAIRFLAIPKCRSFTRHVALQARAFKSSLICKTGKRKKLLHKTVRMCWRMGQKNCCQLFCHWEKIQEPNRIIDF